MTVDPGGTNSSGCLLPGRQHHLRGNPPETDQLLLNQYRGKTGPGPGQRTCRAAAGARWSPQPCRRDTPAHKPGYCQRNEPGRENHAALNRVTPTRPGNKELELNGISESISVPLPAVPAALTCAGRRGWRRGKLVLAADQLSGGCSRCSSLPLPGTSH